MGLSGMLGLGLTLGSRLNPTKTSRWFFICVGAIFVAAIPPMVATMTRGAYAGMALLLVGFIVGTFYMITSGKLTRKQIRVISIGFAMVTGIVLISFATNALDLQTRFSALLNSYVRQSEDVGPAASRTGVWADSINTILQHPIVGLQGSGARETITSEYAKAGRYLSHNVFLDYGRNLGIPGMFLLMWFFFYPVILVFQTKNPGRFIPFVMMHFAMFIFWISLSFQFYKTFWGFWMLMVMAVSRQYTMKPVAAASRRARRIGRAASDLSPSAS
jgi:O-antigen ligase